MNMQDKKVVFEDQNEALKKTASHKDSVVRDYMGTFFLKSIVGGIFIGIGATSMIGIGTLTNVLGGGIGFSIALLLIIFTKSELATGNMLTMVFTGSKIRTVKVALLTTAGNFIGAVSFSFLVFISGFFNEARIDYIETAVTTKLGMPLWIIIIKGIMCNVMVCLAVYISSLVQNDVAKILIVVFAVSVFVVCGWEHSIANMSIFTYGALNSRLDIIPWSLICIVFAWIGNFIGGVGLGFLFKKYKV